MTTKFASLPIVDLGSLKPSLEVKSSNATLVSLGHQLYDAFATTGFAYLVNIPISFDHEQIFALAKEFFAMPEKDKMHIAKKSFCPSNANTYRGYFPTQPLGASDNLKEGFEQGPTPAVPQQKDWKRVNLSEPNVWPAEEVFGHKGHLQQLYNELQNLSAQILQLLAIALNKPEDHFNYYLKDSISTLRLLHYPPVSMASNANGSTSSFRSESDTNSITSMDKGGEIRLSCSPHTDSGLLTLLHQDRTGGLEVRNAADQWIPAPYVPNSIVVNIGDLMAEISGGRFVATMHRVRAPASKLDKDGGDSKAQAFGRFSVPFFFEPGEACVIRSIDDDDGPGIVYGEHVRRKMKTWVEFQDEDAESEASNA